MIYKVLYMPGGAGFLPSTVVSFWDGLFSGAFAVSFREL